MDGVKNFRDLGGILLSDGRRVKHCLFYRSAMLDEATISDLDFLKGLGISCVFDYRDVTERNKEGYKNYEYIGAEHFSCPTYITEGKLYMLQNGKNVFKKIFTNVSVDDVCEYYRLLPFSGSYKPMIEALITGSVPLLQHCTAGKDRAGMGCALLLAVLGADYDAIVEDYLKSNAIKEYLMELMSRRFPEILKPYLLKRYDALFIVDRKMIDAARNEIISRCGTFEAYLLSEYGLTQEIIAELRNKYTE